MQEGIRKRLNEGKKLMRICNRMKNIKEIAFISSVQKMNTNNKKQLEEIVEEKITRQITKKLIKIYAEIILI